MALKRGFSPVAFDELAWQDDLRKASKSARCIGEETRSHLAFGVRRQPPGSVAESVYLMAHRRLHLRDS